MKKHYLTEKERIKWSNSEYRAKVDTQKLSEWDRKVINTKELLDYLNKQYPDQNIDEQKMLANARWLGYGLSYNERRKIIKGIEKW